MRFDDTISKSGFTLLSPEPHPGGDILLAERPMYDDDFGSCKEMLFCIRRGKEDMGQTILVRATDPYQARRRAVIQAARVFITDSIDCGRFPAS